MKMRLSRSIVGQAEAKAVSRVLLEDGYLGMGNETRMFEEELAQFLEVEPWQVVSVNSGTAALHLACQAARTLQAPTKGQPEILVPALTFVASFQAITAAGCKPIACDVLLETGTLDLEDAAKKLTPNTIALMYVDYASNPWNLDGVIDFAKAHGLRLIEDAAHAFGCRHHGRRIGSFGDLVCFSFDGIKNITCGEGGCLVCFDHASADLVGDARLLGVVGDTQKRFAGARSWDADVKGQGYRYHLSNIMAAIGREQLKRLPSEFIPKRTLRAQVYGQRLCKQEHVALFTTDPKDFIVPHIQVIRVLNGKKEAVRQGLEAQGIPTGLHYKPNHLHSFFGGGQEHLPHVEQLFQEIVTLPLHPALSCQDVEEICAAVSKILATA
ncbi:MAG: DegT/DnrJ/EryC1/StrS family aminotransferase [Desulfovibrionaceae bacterium]|nr:DegT/DnrJ/EryC1/StrS family aminotransferase [Desulfovibrionaceae bacterium]